MRSLSCGELAEGLKKDCIVGFQSRSHDDPFSLAGVFEVYVSL